MREGIKREILQQMLIYLDNCQEKALEKVLDTVLEKYFCDEASKGDFDNQKLLDKF